MKLNILIADDEPEARALLIYFIKDLNGHHCITETCDGLATLAALETKNFDLLFLDIKMAGLNGFEVLEKLRSENTPPVIFTTAFKSHALMAFNFDAIDYLLKPFDKTRFNKSFSKAINYLQLKSSLKKKFSSTLHIKNGNKIQIIPIGEVEFFQTANVYIQAITTSHSYLFRSTLNSLETSLNPEDFVRVHKSAIVNQHHIKKIEAQVNGDFFIYTKSGKKLRASRNYKNNFKKIFKENNSKSL